MASLKRKQQARVPRSAFSMRHVIEDLPAAQFFWHKQVSKKNQDIYWHLLGELITLFVSEHEFPLYPHLECSYLFKYISVVSKLKNKFIQTLLDILAFNKDTVDVKLLEYPAFYLDSFVACDLGTQTLDDQVLPWLVDEHSKPILILSFTIYAREREGFHAVFLALIKHENQLNYFFVNPHGNYGETYGTEIENDVFRGNLFNRLIEISDKAPGPFRLPTDLLETCPVLQSYVQGGNCVQWAAMIICFLCMNPSYFHEPLLLITKLGEHPELNILLFSLYFFLKTMPVFTLKVYYYNMFLGAPNKRADFLNESQLFNTFLYQKLSEPVCRNRTIEDCPNTCATCEGKCYDDALVKKQFGRCSVLEPKQIAEKMFSIYVKIQQLANVRIPLNERNEMKQQLINVNVPVVLTEYITMGLLTAKEVDEIQSNERKRKRTK